MKLKQWLKVILVGSSILSLAACSSMHKKADQVDVNDANAAYSDNAESSGLGDDATFGANDVNGQSKLVYYFDYDSNVVHEDDKPAITANASKLASNGKVQVMLEGHTDPRGSREYNIGLGERRAKAVAALLTSKGVTPAQIRVVSYGAEKLAATGRTEDAFQLDRRVVLVYLKR